MYMIFFQMILLILLLQQMLQSTAIQHEDVTRYEIA